MLGLGDIEAASSGVWVLFYRMVGVKVTFDGVGWLGHIVVIREIAQGNKDSLTFEFRTRLDAWRVFTSCHLLAISLDNIYPNYIKLHVSGLV